jgi:hypothetical protein
MYFIVHLNTLSPPLVEKEKRVSKTVFVWTWDNDKEYVSFPNASVACSQLRLMFPTLKTPSLQSISLVLREKSKTKTTCGFTFWYSPPSNATKVDTLSVPALPSVVPVVPRKRGRPPKANSTKRRQIFESRKNDLLSEAN